MDILEALEGHDVAIVADPPMLVFDAPDLEVPDAPARQGPDPRRADDGARGDVGRTGWPAPVRGWRPSRGRDDPASKTARSWRSRSAISSGSGNELGHLERGATRRRQPRPGRDEPPRTCPRRSRPGRRPGLPVGRARGRQDTPGQGVRRRARRQRDHHLAELRPDGRVRGPAAALPYRPVPPRQRRGRARRRPDRRAPGRRGHLRRVARAARATRCRSGGSTYGSTAPATSHGPSR